MADSLYYLDDAAFRDLDAVRVMLALAELMRGRSQAAYLRAAGQHLRKLRHRYGTDVWIELARHECGLARTRAYELTALATSKTSAAGMLAKARARGSARVRKHRRIKAQAQKPASKPRPKRRRPRRKPD